MKGLDLYKLPSYPDPVIDRPKGRMVRRGPYRRGFVIEGLSFALTYFIIFMLLSPILDRRRGSGSSNSFMIKGLY